jgi:cysteine-rich repeat protein
MSRPELRPLALAVVVAAFACMPPGSDEADTADDGDNEPICGDGKVDAPETCDDGNTQPGDGCSAACLLSGTPTQCVTLMQGAGGNADEVNVVIPLTDSFVAGGTLDLGGDGGDVVAWVGKWSEQGEQKWLTKIPPEGSTYLRDLTTDGSGGYWAILASLDTEVLTHLDESGNVLEQIPVSDASLRRGRWAGGRLWVAGALLDELKDASTNEDLWLAVLENGTLETVLFEDHLGFDDRIEAMEIHGDRVLAVATLGTSPGYQDDFLEEPTSEVAVIVLNLNGNELEREALDVGSLETPRATAVRGVGDRWVVAGYAPPVHAILVGDQIWLTNAERDWTWNSLSVFGPQQGPIPQGRASVGGLVTVDSGVVFVGGKTTVAVVGPPPIVENTGWSMEFDSAGHRIWEYHSISPSQSWYVETAVAIDAGGRIRTAGVGWASDASSTMRSCIMER